jgi:hypothetical protein
MLTVDDFVKLILVISVSFAIVIVAWQVARLLGAVTANLQDMRKILQNAGQLSDTMLQDYNRLREFVGSIKGVFSGFGVVKEVVEKFTGLLNFGRSSEKAENSPE